MEASLKGFKLFLLIVDPIEDAMASLTFYSELILDVP